MREALTALLAFVVAAMAGYALTLAAYIAWTELADFSDREGATGMGVALFIGPLVALICGVGAAVWALRRTAS